MMYAKLIDGELHPAPSRITYDEHFVINPSEDKLKSLDYLPVEEEPKPKTTENQYLVPTYSESDGKIIRSWSVKETESEPTPEDRISALEEIETQQDESITEIFEALFGAESEAES